MTCNEWFARSWGKVTASFLSWRALVQTALHILLIAHGAKSGNTLLSYLGVESASMPPGHRNDRPPLTLVDGTSPSSGSGDGKLGPGAELDERADDLDWSILMARAQAGDRDAYRRLLEALAPYLRSLARRHHRDPRDVEDAVQDILMTIHAIRATYDPTRPFRPWLVAIARRRIVDKLRRQGRSTSREVALDPEHETFAVAATNPQEQASNERALRKALEQLPAGQRQAVNLLKLQDMSLKEAAAASGQSIPALKVAMHRALKNLRKILGSGSDET